MQALIAQTIDSVVNLLTNGRQSAGLVGVSVSDERVLIAKVMQDSSRDSDTPLLEKCNFQTLESISQVREVLSTLVEDMDLKGGNCNYVLSPRDYTLYLIEAPAVEESELRSAIRWKIKDLLDMPIEDAAIDIFPVPEEAFQGRSKKMLYVVVASKSRIAAIIELVARSGLKLKSIDVQEMALRNITELFLDDHHGLAFLDLRKIGSTMNLSKDGKLFLTRKINSQLDADVMTSVDWEVRRDRLVLEIQRSLDYYESQMGQSPISQIIMAPRASDSVAMAESLSAVMAVPVTVLETAEKLEVAEGIDREVMRSCLVAIGGALRQEKVVTA